MKPGPSFIPGFIPGFIAPVLAPRFHTRFHTISYPCFSTVVSYPVSYTVSYPCFSTPVSYLVSYPVLLCKSMHLFDMPHAQPYMKSAMVRCINGPSPSIMSQVTRKFSSIGPSRLALRRDQCSRHPRSQAEEAAYAGVI